MITKKENPNRKYLREEKLPHFFCSGCGCGQILNYFTQALSDLGMDPGQMVAIGGVGCAARIPIYLKTDVLHGVHGRTLPWATGIKLVKPDLPVVVFAGDGDIAAIGGNHLIQTARRNLDVTVIVVNNLNFAMTGGQVAPTTPVESITMTTPYGSIEPAFDLVKLSIAAGATHVERWTTSRPAQCTAAIKRALKHKGFSLIEIISQCPTNFGRYALKSGDPIKLWRWINDNTYLSSAKEKFNKEDLENKIECGLFYQEEKPIFVGTSKKGE